MKSEPTRKALWLSVTAVLIVGAFVLFTEGNEEVSNDISTQPAVEQKTEPEPVVEVEPEPDPVEIEYRIVEERDISYTNCKRVAVSTIVPDEANERDVEYTLELLARDYLIEWDDVTIWAWGYSEESQVGKIPATKGTVEDSLPGFCN